MLVGISLPLRSEPFYRRRWGFSVHLERKIAPQESVGLPDTRYSSVPPRWILAHLGSSDDSQCAVLWALSFSILITQCAYQILGYVHTGAFGSQIVDGLYSSHICCEPLPRCSPRGSSRCFPICFARSPRSTHAVPFSLSSLNSYRAVLDHDPPHTRRSLAELR